MSDRDQIIEAMARAVFAGMKTPRLAFSPEFEASVHRQCRAELDAALPLIREALAEKVRDGMHTVETARKAVRAGMAVGEVGAWDEALEQAALLIEEVEL